MTKDNGGPAFPSHGSMGEVTHEGMSLRDAFAAKAMEGLMSIDYDVPCLDQANPEPERIMFALYTARSAYRIADAMLKERRNNHAESTSLDNLKQIKDERDAAWEELRLIRQRIGARDGESTFDEVMQQLGDANDKIEQLTGGELK